MQRPKLMLPRQTPRHPLQALQLVNQILSLSKSSSQLSCKLHWEHLLL